MPAKSAKSPQTECLLVELLTEELPPKSLKRLSEAFAGGVFTGLKEKYFLSPDSQQEEFATPRRLAVRVSGVHAKQPNRVDERKGPSVQAGLDAFGQPSQALLGFARSCGVDPTTLERRRDEKGEYFVYEIRQKGEPLARHLATIVETALKKLPVAKLMRWGAGEAQFVRPVHGVILLHGSKIVPGVLLGLKGGNKTLGHRFMSKGWIEIAHANNYDKVLRKKGKVIAAFTERRHAIVDGLRRQAATLNAQFSLPGYRDRNGQRVTARFGQPADADDDSWNRDRTTAAWIDNRNGELLDEVTALVEWPVVYVGEFDRDFLTVPPQCLSLTMQKNQKYFALMNQQAKLLPKYLIVSNMETRAPARMIDGNARVLRARLSDAKFFYDQDRKHRLEERVPRLADVVYHNKLGTQLERVQRLVKLAGRIAVSLGANSSAAERAAYLCKADLLTEMVSEFPELQGLMGYHYAQHDREPQVVAAAIRGHYLPRFADDHLPWPWTREGTSLALADRLDALVGIYGIGLVPTGNKDPFGLRRAALGVARILIEPQQPPPLDLVELIDQARGLFPSDKLSDKVTEDLHGFFLDRLRSYLRKNYAPDEIEAVLALKPTRLDHVLPRLDALKKFRERPEGMALAAANKRIQNILRQAGDGDPEKITPAIDGALFREEAEKELARQLDEVARKVHPFTAAGKYDDALTELSNLRGAVDAFFDKVMVMVDDENLRTARLQMLAEIRREFRQIADISRLQNPGGEG